MDKPKFDTRDNCKADRDEIAKAVKWFMEARTVLELRTSLWKATNGIRLL